MTQATRSRQQTAFLAGALEQALERGDREAAAVIGGRAGRLAAEASDEGSAERAELLAALAGPEGRKLAGRARSGLLRHLAAGGSWACTAVM